MKKKKIKLVYFAIKAVELKLTRIFNLFNYFAATLKKQKYYQKPKISHLILANKFSFNLKED